MTCWSCGSDNDEVLFDYTLDFEVTMPFNGDVFLSQLIDIQNVANIYEARREALGFAEDDVRLVRIRQARIQLLRGEPDMFFLTAMSIGIYAFDVREDIEIAFREPIDFNPGQSLDLFAALPDVTDLLKQDFINLTMTYRVRQRNIESRVRVLLDVEAVR